MPDVMLDSMLLFSLRGLYMIKRFFALLILLAVFSASAFAHSCPIQMKKIDKALAKNSPLTAEQLAEVQRMRALGAELHEADLGRLIRGFVTILILKSGPEGYDPRFIGWRER